MPTGDTTLRCLVVPRAVSGYCLHEHWRERTAAHPDDFLPGAAARRELKRHLQALRFDVHDTGGPALAVSGPASLFRSAFRAGSGADVLRGALAVSRKKHPDLWGLAPALAAPEPVHLFAKPQPALAVPLKAPRVPYHHFAVPDGVADAFHVAAAHKAGFTGKGITVAVCDSGCGPHPYLDAPSFHIRRKKVAGVSGGVTDDVGHGTAIVANLLALAPEADVVSIRMNFDGGNSDTTSSVLALQMAAKENAQVINCSWGVNMTSRKELTAGAVHLGHVVSWLSHSGRVVVAASGDFPREDPKSSGIFAFPAQHPETIAAGGAGITDKGELQAASYASGFRSNVYAGRNVPDVAGLCGDLPAGVLLMSPVPPGCIIDKMASANPYPAGDGTKPDDGWACFSGTSLAAAHVSACAALALQAAGTHVGVHVVRALLMASARDVIHGEANPQAAQGGRVPEAHKGYDLATGAGLVDVDRLIRSIRANQPKPARTRSSPAS